MSDTYEKTSPKGEEDEHGQDVVVIAMHLNRTESSVQNKAQESGVSSSPPWSARTACPPWTPRTYAR